MSDSTWAVIAIFINRGGWGGLFYLAIVHVLSRCTSLFLQMDVLTFYFLSEDGSENGRYFLEGSYTGHFRFTQKNNCTTNPNCTGHFSDYPCSWTSYAKQQAHHLNIALEIPKGSDGYSYSEMVDIWHAANATKSDAIGLWWRPDAIATELEESGSGLVQVRFREADAC